MKGDTSRLTSRYIVPFFYDNNELGFDRLSESCELWTVAPYDKQECDLYDYIVDSFITDANFSADEHDVKAACMYRYTGKIPDYNYVPSGREAKHSVRIPVRDNGLVLFQNGIGFFWHEVCITDESIFVDFTNKVKELARSNDNGVRYEVTLKKGEDPIPEDAIHIIDNIYKMYDGAFRGIMINGLLKTLGCRVDYNPQRTHDDISIPDKMLVFHHAVFADKSNIVESAYRLTRGYNKNYKVDDMAESEMLHPFDNVWFCASTEGCGYYSYQSDVNIDSSKVMCDYFMLYILSLYQEYAVLRLSNDISKELPASYSRYESYSKRILNRLKRLNTRVNAFFAKDVYSSVSHVQHQNDYYDYLIEKLRIKENIESISSGIAALRDIQSALESDRRDGRERILNALLAVIAVLGILQTIASIPTIIDMFVH